MPHVLIVEDDPLMQEFFGSLLRHHGYTTETASDGQEGFERAQQRRPCMVLLDLVMPRMNGWEFRAKQLETPGLAEVPVVCITGSVAGPTGGDVFGAPCFPKPVNCDAVMQAIRDACGRRPIQTAKQELARYDPWRGAQTIGDLFVLLRNGRTARCELRTHTLGWELRLTGAAREGFELSQVCRTEGEVLETADQWKARLIVKGWQ
jgi:CheY-like chemotaxis protein